MTLPDVSGALFGWETATTFKLITKTVADHEVDETFVSNKFQGVFQPSSWQQIVIKPEGQRTWRWWSLITQQNLNLDDIVLDSNNVEYRVMMKHDYSQGGYYAYDLTEGFRKV